MTRKINCNWETPEAPVDKRDIWLRNEVLRKQKSAEAQVQMNKKIDAEFIANVPARVRDDVMQRIKVAKENIAAKEAKVRDRELLATKLRAVEGVTFKTAAAASEYAQYKRLRSAAKYGHLYDAEYVAYTEYKQLPENSEARKVAYAEYMRQYGATENAVRELELRAEKESEKEEAYHKSLYPDWLLETDDARAEYRKICNEKSDNDRKIRIEQIKAYAVKNKVAVITATQKHEDNMAWDESIRNSISKGYEWL